MLLCGDNPTYIFSLDGDGTFFKLVLLVEEERESEGVGSSKRITRLSRTEGYFRQAYQDPFLDLCHKLEKEVDTDIICRVRQ